MATVRKHDWPRYANGDPKPVPDRSKNRKTATAAYQCRRCGTMFVGFTFEEADVTECLQPELPGLEDLPPG